MLYYKSESGEVFQFSDEAEKDRFGPAGLTLMSESEVIAHTNPALSYSQALAKLNKDYQEDVDKFNRSFAVAYLSDGPSQESKQATIRAQYEVRKTQHAENVAALKIQYGV